MLFRWREEDARWQLEFTREETLIAEGIVWVAALFKENSWYTEKEDKSQATAVDEGVELNASGISSKT